MNVDFPDSPGVALAAAVAVGLYATTRPGLEPTWRAEVLRTTHYLIVLYVVTEGSHLVIEWKS